MAFVIAAQSGFGGSKARSSSSGPPKKGGCEPQDAGALEEDEAGAWVIAEAEDSLGDAGSDDAFEEFELGESDGRG